MADRRVVSFALLAGGILVTAGAIYYLRRQSRPERLGLSDAEDSGEYKLTEHRSETMPIKERMRILQDLTARSIKDPRMRKISLKATSGCPARDGDCEARAIFKWIDKNIRYTGDIGPHALWAGGPVEGVDLFQSAYRTVEFGGGDCDDHAVLACTMAALNGLACKYRVTSTTRGRKDDYSHIYAMIGQPKLRPKKWAAVDTTLPHKKFGLEAPYGKKLDFPA